MKKYQISSDLKSEFKLEKLPRSEKQKNFNDLPELIERVLHPFGRYQVLIFFALSYNSIIFGMNHTLTAFHTYTPTFYCKDDVNKTINSCALENAGECPSGLQFGDDDNTLVTEWSLVCNRRLMAPLVNTLYFVGVTFGSVLCGIMIDKWGRRNTVYLCLFGQGILGFLLRYAPKYEFFVSMRLIQGFFVQGLQGSSLALVIEYSPPRFRTMAGVSWSIHWAMGLAVLGGMSYFVRDWRMLQMVVTVPTMLAMLWFWTIPESLTWLYATNQKKESLDLCLKVAKRNKSAELVKDIKMEFKDKLNEAQKTDQDTTENTVVKAGLLDIWHTASLRKHLFIQMIVNYGVALSYFGSVYFLHSVKGDRHLNFIISAGIEVIGNMVAYVLLSRAGRRAAMLTIQLSAALLCVLIGLTIQFGSNGISWKAALVTTMALTVKGIAEAGLTSMNIYTTELFPTICRGAAFGVIGLFARIGCITAPFLMILSEYMSPLVPMSILCFFLITTACATYYLPETLNQVLPNTIEDAIDLWEKPASTTI